MLNNRSLTIIGGAINLHAYQDPRVAACTPRNLASCHAGLISCSHMYCSLRSDHAFDAWVHDTLAVLPVWLSALSSPSAAVGTATLDFGFVPGAIALESGSKLQLANLTVQNATSLKQPLPTTGVFEYKSADNPFWPSIIFEPNSGVRQAACRAAACVTLA